MRAEASPWRGAAPLLLASTSATRRMLLEGAGLPVETEAPGIDERALEAAAREGAAEIARRLAAEKALAVSRRNQVDPRGDLWMAVLESTGQPVRFT